MHIKYKNLTIRDAVAADAELVTAWWNDGAVMAHAGFPNGLGTTIEDVIAGLGDGSLVLEEGERLIGEACYMKYFCLIMSKNYIRNHFASIKRYASVIENRLNDEWCTLESVLEDNAQFLVLAQEYNVNYVLIDDEYEINIEL